MMLNQVCFPSNFGISERERNGAKIPWESFQKFKSSKCEPFNQKISGENPSKAEISEKIKFRIFG